MSITVNADLVVGDVKIGGDDLSGFHIQLVDPSGKGVDFLDGLDADDLRDVRDAIDLILTERKEA